MDQEILTKVTGLEGRLAKLEATWKRAKRALTIAAIIYAAMFILPLIGLAIALPYYVKMLNTALSF